MAFFVVLRRADAALSIPLPEAFPTREAAISALSAASSAGSVVLDGEVFIADLGAAVPVLIMQHAAPAAALAEEAAPMDEVEQAEEAPAEEAPAEEAPAAEPGILDEVEAEAAYADYSPLAGLTDESTLAAALKRAATSLEDEGIVAPESIESAPEADVQVAEEPVEAQPEPEPAEEQSWPWTNVEAYTATETEAADEELVSEALPEVAEELAEESMPLEEPAVAEAIAEPLGVEETPEPEPEPDLAEDLYELAETPAEPIADDAPIITSAPLAGEEAYVPRPVILGDYADEPAAVIETEAVAPEPEDIEEPTPAIEIAEPAVALVVDEPEAELEAAPEPEEPSLGEPSDDAGDELSALVAEATAMGGYEAAGELNLAEYTCQDCVYANTCPKVGEAAPANCGSFQWRSA